MHSNLHLYHTPLGCSVDAVYSGVTFPTSFPIQGGRKNVNSSGHLQLCSGVFTVVAVSLVLEIENQIGNDDVVWRLHNTTDNLYNAACHSSMFLYTSSIHRWTDLPHCST